MVFGAGGGIELLEGRLVGEVHFDGSAFENDDIVARFEMNGEGGIVG